MDEEHSISKLYLLSWLDLKLYLTLAMCYISQLARCLPPTLPPLRRHSSHAGCCALCKTQHCVGEYHLAWSETVEALASGSWQWRTQCTNERHCTVPFPPLGILKIRVYIYKRLRLGTRAAVGDA